MSFKEVEKYYGDGVEKTIEMQVSVPCVDGPYENADDGKFVAGVDIMPSEFDSDECTGCDLYEICVNLDRLHQILKDHSLGLSSK